MDLLDLLESLDISLENIDWDQFVEDHEDAISYSDRKDHPMSGYQGSFEACDFDITITRKSETEFDSGAMVWEEVFEEYDDLRSGKGEKSSWTKTFSTFEKAIKYADENLEFEG